MSPITATRTIGSDYAEAIEAVLDTEAATGAFASEAVIREIAKAHSVDPLTLISEFTVDPVFIAEWAATRV